MSGFNITVQNQTDISSIRVVGVSVNPNIRFSVDANQNGQGMQSNLQARGSRGLIAYDLGSEEVFATGAVAIPNTIDSVSILVLGDSSSGYAFDFSFN